MKPKIVLLAVLFVAAVAASSRSSGAGIEAVKAKGDQVFTKAAASIPVTLEGEKAQRLRCEARLWQRGTRLNRCSWGSVVTAVQILPNNVANLTCHKITVTCR